MKKSDLGLAAVIYCVCLFFFVQTLDLPEEAQTYPLCLICALAVLNTVYVFRSVLSWVRTRTVENDVAVSFASFLPSQFISCCLLFAAYMVLLWAAGFYVSTLAYLIVSMCMLRVPKMHIAITTAVLASVIWAVFTLFLKVPLPVGILFK